MTLSQKPELSIVLPCYNESRGIEAILTRFEEVRGSVDCELILVDNGSKDRTPEVMRSLLPRFPTHDACESSKTRVMVTGSGMGSVTHAAKCSPGLMPTCKPTWPTSFAPSRFTRPPKSPRNFWSKATAAAADLANTSSPAACSSSRPASCEHGSRKSTPSPSFFIARCSITCRRRPSTSISMSTRFIKPRRTAGRFSPFQSSSHHANMARVIGLPLGSQNCGQSCDRSNS